MVSPLIFNKACLFWLRPVCAAERLHDATGQSRNQRVAPAPQLADAMKWQPIVYREHLPTTVSGTVCQLGDTRTKLYKSHTTMWAFAAPLHLV